MSEMHHIITETNEKPDRLTVWRGIKSKHPDVLVIFRDKNAAVLLEGDAEEAARTLGIPVSRHVRWPWHETEMNVARLIAHGKRVTICEEPGGDG